MSSKPLFKATARPRPPLLVVVSGPSGAGKSTICQRYVDCRPTAKLIVSCTTRPPREGEREGVDYHFMTRSDFMAGVEAEQFLEHAEVHGNLYGTPRDQFDESYAVGRDTILEIDTQGGLQVRAKLPETLLVFVHTGEMDILEHRLVGRGTDSPEVIDIRLRNAQKELDRLDQYDYCIVNDDLDRAVSEFEAVLTAERLSLPRLKRALGLVDGTKGAARRRRKTEA